MEKGNQKSFLLRNARGHVGGYLICTRGEVLLKADAGRKTRLMLLDSNGRTSCIDVQCDGLEHAYPVEGIAVHAVLADIRGEWLLCDDWQAASNCMMKHTAGEAVMQEDDRLAVASQKDEANPPDSGSGKGEAEECKCPIRRWPPPPCMPEAVYCCGVWKETQDTAEKALDKPADC